MISRKAILIGAPSVPKFLQGVLHDLEDMKDFLCSDAGGAWRENEIVTLIDQPGHVVMEHVRAAKDVDYVFILCAGHGEHHSSGTDSSTVICLTETEDLAIDLINPRNKRHFVVVDVCRDLVPVQEISKAVLKAAMESYSAEDKFDYRTAFDSAVMDCPEGRIVAYSCSVDQSAGETNRGGMFTQSLIASHEYFSPNSGSHGLVTVEQAFEWAKNNTYEKNAPQMPVLEAGRRRVFYPFAIVRA
ncbi:caspase family protein [Pseudomonas sp. RC3H12]|uniref:caspase family protein n=1 Tax=Pseudomonas sp. RC3H12 TaxID=2834406 RepID=UPI001BDF2CC3|nr:caspase family protein [Pseudomonas sp. RC3H12]QWA30540.1 caspase family protein [Pseudomonas sp. RC3H12]